MQRHQPYSNYMKRENLTYYTNTASHIPLGHPLAIDTGMSLQENCYYYYCAEDNENTKPYDLGYSFHDSFNNLFEDILECSSPLSSPEIMPTQSPLYSDYMSTASFSPNMTTLVDSKYISEYSILDTGSELYQSSVTENCIMRHSNNNYNAIKEESYPIIYPKESHFNIDGNNSQEFEYSNYSASIDIGARSNRGRSSSNSSNRSSSSSNSESESCQTPASDTPSYNFDNYTLASSNDNRPYSCHFCSRAFTRKHDLQRHIRVHTGEKPYACPCCKKAFSRTDALKRHLRMEEQCRNSQEVYEMKKNGKRRYRNL